MKKCGYSFWGYLGDIKYDRYEVEASTPDGNAFYSWCIIRELQKRGYEVTQIMPDRDDIGYELKGDSLFSSWVEREKVKAYKGTKKIDWWSIIDKCKKDVEFHQNKVSWLMEYIRCSILDELKNFCKDLEFIFHEYRMWVPGRNDFDSILNDHWQPDYFIQQCLFEYCCRTHKKLILFDLDYKLKYRVYKELREKGCPVTIFELGKKWEKTFDIVNDDLNVKQVYIPFDFDYIDYFSDNRSIRNYNLVYVGNRYERDWCIDKYIPDNLDKCIIFGNWLECNRDSKERWPNLYFGERLQTKKMRDVYVNSVATILLAKKEYCTYNFMTARIIESIFYGTVPLFIEEYGEGLIEKYAGIYADFLTVKNAKDVCLRIEQLRSVSNGVYIERIIEYMRKHLSFMDVKNFVDALMEVKEWNII